MKVDDYSQIQKVFAIFQVKKSSDLMGIFAVSKKKKESKRPYAYT